VVGEAIWNQEHAAVSRQELGPYLLLILVAFMIGLTWPVGKLALTEIEPWALRTVTTVGSGIILLGYTCIRGQSLWSKPEDIQAIAATAVFNVTAVNMLSAFGLRITDATHAVIIINTMPVWATMLSVWLIAEPVKIRSILALGLMLISLVILMGGNIESVSQHPGGPMLLLLSAIAWAYGTIRQKQLKTDLDVSAVAGWQLILGAIPMFLGMLFWGTPSDFLSASPVVLAVVSYSLFSKGILFWLWLWVIELLPAHVASIGTAAAPVFGALASGVVLGEDLGVSEASALALVVVGMIVLAAPKQSD